MPISAITSGTWAGPTSRVPIWIAGVVMALAGLFHSGRTIRINRGDRKERREKIVLFSSLRSLRCIPSGGVDDLKMRVGGGRRARGRLGGQPELRRNTLKSCSAVG